MKSDLIAALRPLTSRVRTDVTCIKKADGTQAWTRDKLTDARIAKHLNGGPARGCCPIKAGESVTLVGLYDLDSHQGEAAWPAMTAAAMHLIEALELLGMQAIPFRSSGGRGIHLFLLWDEPQDAYSVRRFMIDTIEALGFKNGTAGVSRGEIEVFPKQDSVAADGFGNQFILPLAGKSEPLEPLADLEPLGRDAIVRMAWPVSTPVPVLEKPQRGELVPVEGTAFETLRSALAAIPNQGDAELSYDDWRNVVFGIHHATGGSDEGLALAHEFSSKAAKYDPAFLDARVWPFVRPREDGVTERSILALARTQGWAEDVSGDFEDHSTQPLSTAEQDEQAAIRKRNTEIAARIAQAAIDKATAPTLADIVAIIDNNDIICLDSGELASRVIADLAKARLGSIDEETILKRLKEVTGLSIKTLRDAQGEARRKGPGENYAGVDADLPVHTARAFIQKRYITKGVPTLRHWQDEFLTWDGIRYQAISSADIRSQIYALFDAHKVCLYGRGPVDNVLDALKALANVPSTKTMPGWLCAIEPVPASELIAVRNGLLHVPTRDLLAHDPRYFSAGSVDVIYSPDASQPAAWLKFLNDAFPDDPESIDALQQWFGYLLTQDTTQQKALICVGPKRCGKGTIARVLRALLGEHNCSGPTLGQLSHQFGKQGLIGKSLAIISDARVGGAADLQGISETILRITGEDAISVERKNMADWVGKLTTRFVLMTNILPGIVDAGGAVGSRFIVLKFSQSFFGREDPKLTDKLIVELPGILNWALDGLAMLHERGSFIQPAAGTAAVDELIRKTTPILGFVADTIAYDTGRWISKDALYDCYKTWCSDEGMRFTLQKNAFFCELYANTDGRLAAYSPRVGTGRVKAVRGARMVDGWNARISTFERGGEEGNVENA